MSDINYGEILEAINDKVDLSSSWGAPSAQYIDLSWPSSGDLIQAPADGWFRAKCHCNAGGMLYIGNAANDMRMRVLDSYETDTEVFTPVKKGQGVYIVYSGVNDNSPSLRFIYNQKTN